MKWEKWTLDNLPPPRVKVLIWYKSGYHGAIEFFSGETSKEMYIRSMKFYEENPDSRYEGKIKALKIIEKEALADPITHWMYFPDGPKREEE
jgi:hypothetical protein